jgi:hypothetical protein
MRELATLLLIVLLVYLFQCLCWAPPGAQVFSLEPASRRKRGFLWVALNLRVHLANPLPPLQPLVVVEWPGFQLEPEAVRLNPADGEPISVPWDQLAITRSGRKLLCNGQVVLHGGAEQIKSAQELLAKLKRAQARERKKQIEAWLRKATDTQAAAERLKLFFRKARWLDLASNLQFFLLFMIVPMAFYRFGSRALWPLVEVVVSTSILVAWQSWRLHKVFLAGDGDARFKSVFSTVLSPIYAVRAADALARDLVAGFHPVAVAGILCSQKDFAAFAGEQLRANKFGQTGASWYRDQLQLALIRMIQKNGIDSRRLLAPPEQDANCVVYCPRCLAQYTASRAACADCAFEGLLEFAGTAGRNARTAADRPPAP